MLLTADPLTVRQPNVLDRIKSRLFFHDSYAKRRHMPALSAEQRQHVEALRGDGCIVLQNYLPQARLRRMQADLNDALSGLKFEMPCLAQSRVDPKRHAELIGNFMYGTPAQMARWGVAFDRSEARSYDQVVADFNPSTLTVYMLEHSAAYRDAWLDPYLLGIVSGYLGMVPKLAEAYVRRNFPAPYRTMNHYWHRDVNTPFHLLKIFFFLSDCSEHTGPHEFVRGSHRNLDALNGKRYFTDAEVDSVYPPRGAQRVLSEVSAGTVVIEDTRGLHRAQLPQTGHRDLGYAVFMPLRPFYPYRNYVLPAAALDALSPFQRAFIPRCMLA